MPVRGWLHQASKRLLSRSGKNQVSRQRNGTVKPSGLRLHATPCTHPGPANCITSCSDAKKKLSWLTFSSSGEFWVYDTDLRPGICQIRTASNSHFTPDSQIPDSRHETSEFLPKLKPGDGVESIGKWSIGETARVGPRGSLRWPPGAGVTRGWNRTFGFVRSHIFKFVGDGQYGVVPVIKIPHKNGVGTLESDRSLSNRDRQGRRKKAQMSQNVLIE